MNTNPVSLFTTNTSPELTMSSREIAELTGKRHDNVMRDIRTMLIALYGEDELEQSVPEKYRNRHSEYIRENADALFAKLTGDSSKRRNEGFRGFSWERDNRGYISVFNLDYSHTMTLIAGYNVKLRKGIIDRWQELEATKHHQHQDPIQVLNDPAAMRGLLLTYTEKVLALEETNAELVEEVQEQAEQIAEDAPKVRSYHRFLDDSGTLGLREVATLLHVGERKLSLWLQEHDWVYRHTITDKLQPCAKKMQTGHLDRKPFDSGYGVHYQLRFTPKGIAHLDRILPAALRYHLAA